jgi:3-dehydroquinate synthase
MSGFTVSFNVPFSYRVRFTHGAFDLRNPTLRCVIDAHTGPTAVSAFVDEGVMEAWPDLIPSIRQYATDNSDIIELIGDPTILAGGEQAKNGKEVVDTVLRRVEAADLCRHSYVLAIGGGAVLDAVGFAAATAHRGLRLIRLPTTTLAQADAGLGVKNGINAFGKKNFVGCFAPPWAVINDDRFLTTLSLRDWRAGFAEAIKVALLKDPAFFTHIETSTQGVSERREGVAPGILRRAAELHVNHISQGGDPFERQAARPLDFGHWSAHKLEEASAFRLRHGEAVAIGIALDTVISTIERGLTQSDAQRILKCILSTGLPVYNLLLQNYGALREGMEQFRQHLGGRLSVTLLDGIGKPVEVHDIDFASVIEAVRYLSSYVPARSQPSSSYDDETYNQSDDGVSHGGLQTT